MDRHSLRMARLVDRVQQLLVQRLANCERRAGGHSVHIQRQRCCADDSRSGDDVDVHVRTRRARTAIHALRRRRQRLANPPLCARRDRQHSTIACGRVALGVVGASNRSDHAPHFADSRSDSPMATKEIRLVDPRRPPPARYAAGGSGCATRLVSPNRSDPSCRRDSVCSTRY